MKKIIAFLFIITFCFTLSCKKNDKSACKQFHDDIMKLYSSGVIKEKFKQHYVKTEKKSAPDGTLCRTVVVMKPYKLTKDEKFMREFNVVLDIEATAGVQS